MRTDLEVLAQYVRSESGYKGMLDPQADLLDLNILDSFSVVQLAMFIQEHFGIELEADDLIRDNLGSLSSMVALIDKRRSGADH